MLLLLPASLPTCLPACAAAQACLSGWVARSLRRAPPVPRCAALCRDQSSYTRVAVLQTWEYLAEHRAVPLGHWRSVTEIAKGAAAAGDGLRGVGRQFGIVGACGRTRPLLAAYGSPWP